MLNKHFVAAFCAATALTGPAWAQGTAGPAPNAPPAGQQTPNAATPPGGIARGVVPPPRGVDPGMVTPPAGTTQGTMPILKPPAGAR